MLKKIINKITILILCIGVVSNINYVTYGSILDVITEETSVDNTLQEENEIINSEENTKKTEYTNISSTESNEEKITFSDIEDHWAENWIIESVKLGFVSGYEDGTFKPDRTITRAEFSKLLNNAMHIENESNLDFVDVKESDWFYEEVQKSVASGFFTGYEDNTFRPNNPITREEVAKVVSNSITTGDIDGEGATELLDYNTIQDWAKLSVNTVYNKGYILGYPSGDYMPSKALTRGEAVKIIYEIVENENIERGFNITNFNESYYGAIVIGNLNVLDSVGSGNAYIRNVVVLGDIVISANNVNSIELTDVKARNIIVENESNPVKIICNDNIFIGKTQLPSVAVIERLGININI